jgi:hypothetical protein
VKLHSDSDSQIIALSWLEVKFCPRGIVSRGQGDRL